MNQNNYLGTENVGKLLRQFAIPCIFSLIISCLYNIVDQIFMALVIWEMPLPESFFRLQLSDGEFHCSSETERLQL